MFKSTVVYLLLSTIVGISFAQNREAPPPMDTVNIPANVQKNVEIYISRVTFDNTEKIYKPGQTLSWKVEIYYPGEATIKGIQWFLSLWVDLNEKWFPGQKVVRISLGTFDFTGTEKRTIPFSFELPNLDIDKFNIYWEFLSQSDAPVGFYNGADIFELQGTKKILTIKDAYIRSKNTQKTYFMWQWPWVWQGTPNTALQVVLDFHETDISFLPFQMNIFRDVIGGEDMGKQQLALEGKSWHFEFDIPDMKEPGVYVAQIFATSNNFELLPLQFRWIVWGPSARIKNLMFDEQDILLSVVGTPHPSTYGASWDIPGNDFSGRVVMDFRGSEFFMSDLIPLSGYEKTLKISKSKIFWLWLGGDINARVLLSDGKVLTSSSIHIDPNMKTIGWYIASWVMILIMIFMFFHKRVKKPISRIVSFFLLGIIVFASTTKDVEALAGPYTVTDLGHSECAAEWYSYPTLSLSSPASGQEAICNQTIQVTGQMIHGACENTGIGGFSSKYRFINTVTTAHSDWSNLSPAYTSGEPGGWHTWNPIYYELNETVTVPANARDYDAIEFYIVHDIGCGASLYYYQPMTGICCSGGVPQNAVKCNETDANVDNQPVHSCTGTKACEYDCIEGYIPDIYPANDPVSIDCRLPICLVNTAAGVFAQNTAPANSYVLSNDELPESLKLTQDYSTVLRWSIQDNQHTFAEVDRTGTVAGCEYSCTDWFIPDGEQSCRRARCLPNTAIGVTTTDTAPENAHPISLDEIWVTGKLVRDYQTLLVDPGVNGTPTQDPTKWCEYTCNDGYRMVTEWSITKCVANVCIETSTNKKASNGSVCQDNTASNGVQATATSNANGTLATVGTGGTTYVNAPYVTVTGGSCTVRPIATSTISSGSVTAVTLTGAVACTVAPTLTIARPNSDDSEYISLHADKPYLNVAMNGSAPNCTSQNKCEWYCPTTTPYYCGVTNTCVARAVDCCPTGQSYCSTTNSCATSCASCGTSAPSELKAGVDQPYISCATIDSNTHFRYKISSGGATSIATATARLGTSSVEVTITSAWAGYTTAPAVTFSWGTCTVAPQATATVTSGAVTAITITSGNCTIAPTTVTIAAPPASSNVYISPNTYTTGTQVKHPFALDAGTYTVTCLYGWSSTPAENMTANATSCNKTMTVTANSTKGCSSIIGYRGDTLSNEMTSNTAFNASFRCGSRSAIAAGTVEPYHLRVGSELARLNDDTAFLAIFGGGLGGISTQTQQYPFVTNNTPVECAVKVGDGYSTNNSCKITTCVGLDCVAPETFVITHSTEAICTPNTDTTYDIGCNDQSPDYTSCVNWLYSGFSGTNSFTRTLDVKINGVAATREVTCTISRPAGALNDIKNCTLLLPTGNVPVTVFGGENNVFQTTRYTLERDTQAPSASIAYYAKNGNGSPLTNLEYWQNQPATAVITCTDAPGASDGTNCACAMNLDGDTDALWSIGVPNSDASLGTRWPDIMKYSRTITSSGPFSAVKVQDTAGLKSSVAINIDIKIDSIAPKVVPSSNGTSVTLVMTDTGGSGLWKPLTSYTQNPSAGIASGAALYKTGSKTDASVPFASETCIAQNNADYYKISETSSSSQTAVIAVSGVTNDINTTTAVLAYCVQDNAGNVTRWVYPSTPVACFSASNMSTVPKLSLTNNYIAPLIARITSATPQYGYGMSEDTNTANCFRGIISSNISRLVSSQYNSTLLNNTSNPINWSDAAKIKTNPTIANTNGYYYYTTNNGTNNTTLTINSSPAGRGTKTVVAEGANIHITNNINYLDEGDSTKILILIAKKNPTTGTGWNIYVDPSVTNIDAILIADGSLLNGSATATPSNITSLDWLTSGETNLISNRLTINGRLYSMNTRWGSLTGSGTILSAIAPWAGKYFNPANSQLSTPATVNLAAEQDLERFRYINDDGTAQCTLHINYKTIPVNELPEILVKSGDYSGCNF